MRHGWLWFLICVLLLGVPARAQQSVPGQWTGRASALIEDDFVNRRSQTHWELVTEEGNFEMYFAGRAPRVSGSNVTIQGLRSGNRIAVSGILAQAPAASPQCTTTGQQKIAVLMVTTPSNPAFPSEFTSSAIQQKFFGPATDDLQTESVNSLWQQMSDLQTSATGQVFGPFGLSRDFECDDYSSLKAAAISSADPAVDFTQFNRVALLFPVQTCSYGGLSTIGCQSMTTPSKGRLQASFSWLPVSSGDEMDQSLAIYTHELGHSLGLGHAASDDYGSAPLGPLADSGELEEYGDLFSLMGAVQRYFYGQPYMGQYSAQHKRLLLNWLKPASVREVRSSGRVTLAPFERSSGLRALRILRDAVSGAWLWAEYRQPIGSIDDSLSVWKNFGPTNIFDGALIHYEDPVADPWETHLLKFNYSSSSRAFLNSTLTPGGTWSDPYSLLTLTVNSADSSGLSMTVNYDQPCATLNLPSAVFPSIGGSGSIAVAASPACSWTASTAADWITLTGRTSGQGDGTVSFTVPPVSTSLQRNGHITVQRQSVPIVQTGTGASVLSATPASGSGSSGRFTFEFSDEHGYSGISSAHIHFSDNGNSFNGSSLPECEIEVSQAGGAVRLQNDAASLQLGPIYFATPGQSISNSQCTVYSTGSSMSGAGNRLTITLQVAFSSSFSGTHRITGEAASSTGDTDPIPLGIWSVAASPSRSLPPRGPRAPAP
jgi:M6 family metalloprotease-like protein